ncbi:type VI secretion system contractile sheath large subunit [Marinibactrum halimedae]|uniref:Intracellular growth locus iglB n=1 Tax=Marinibactrum halimedae TaxID=1444977 RepID=A0AA37WL76_9GAMM|nr:type VI secretion system contractile sheath large subunit [Marinibactrum halimedae]MCD9458106.1 type VI secretion system contractile sheath large subunit [Marinibactrum halimedae]GLS25040.1 intracellular growth locus iglB [Marinibactrum halimedae]
MSAEIIEVPNDHIVDLGASLNYLPETLESLLDKKVRIKNTQKLEESVSAFSDCLSDYDESDDVSNIKLRLQSIKEQGERVQNVFQESDVYLDKSISSLLSSNLEAIFEGCSASELAFSEMESIEEGGEEQESEVRRTVSRLINGADKLSKVKSTISEKLRTDSALNLNDNELAADYFLGCMATALFNDILPENDEDGFALAHVREKVTNACADIDEKINRHVNAILHNEEFKDLEANWLGLNGLIESTDWSANLMIDVLDCTKEEVMDDLANNAVDLTNSELFKKIYVSEYDQYGGCPYGALIGLYEFENTDRDRRMLSTAGKVAAASHAPFISSVGPKFLACNDIKELSEIKDLEAHLGHPRFEKWNQFRESEEAAYIGLSLPKFLLRKPYESEPNEGGFGFEEKIDVADGHKDYLWCNSAFLVCKNMIRSFAETGWCQYIRGPKGGGNIEYLPRHEFKLNGQSEIKAPVEMIIPDYKELQFSNAGFMPLVYKKGTSNACFFSCQSIKKTKKFKDPQDSQNSQLVTNLSYTMSITRIAHYIKCMMRDNIGSSATQEYINAAIENWLSQYVTTVVNPDDLTLRYYPFQSIKVETKEQEGMIGWYSSNISVMPHRQFEGLDVELSLDVRT